MSSSHLHRLPASTALRLSSGQAISSVSAAVKELLENSLDAGADAVEVRLEDFGLEKIVVQDNGCGISKGDLPLAAARHHTSKISTFQDLCRLSTFGFRGEALSSCCELADVELASRTEGDSVGARVAFDAEGRPTGTRAAPMRRGTTATVGRLFSRLPVRRKVHERDSKKREELKKVEKLCLAYAIVTPNLRLSLSHRGCAMLKKPPAPPPGDLRSSASACLPVDVVANLVHMRVKMETGGKDEDGGAIAAELLVPGRGCFTAETTRSNADRTFVFVNDRPVNDKSIVSLLKKVTSEAASPSSGAKSFPVSVASVWVPASILDANLEPNKQTVVFRGSDALLELMETRLRHYYGLVREEKAESMEDSALIERDLLATEGESRLNSSQSSNEENLDGSLQEEEEEGGGPLIQDIFKGKKTSLHKAQKSAVVAALAGKGAGSSGDRNGKSVLDVDEEDIFSRWDEDVSEKSTQEQSSTVLKQADLKSWSKGLVLKDCEGVAVEPVTIVPPAKRARTTEHSATTQEEDNRLDSFLVRMEKRRKEVGDRTLREQARGPLGTPQVANRRGQVRVLRKVAQVCFDPGRTREAGLAVEPRAKEVVGRLDESQFWVCRVGRTLHLLSHHRAEEAALYERLLSFHRLPCNALPTPRELLLSEEESRALGSLKRHGEDGRRSEVADERLLMNGFRVLLGEEESKGARRVQVTGACPAVEAVAAAELKEILREVVKNPDIDIGASRPPKVRSFLLSESVRMSRQGPPGVDRWRAEEMLRGVDGNEATCPHGRDILSELCRL